MIDFRLASAPDLLRHLGQRLRQQRLQKPWTQQDLATHAGVALSAVKKLEAGGNATLKTLVKVVQALSLAEELAPLFAPKAELSIAALAKAEKPQRQRARPRRAAP